MLVSQTSRKETGGLLALRLCLRLEGFSQGIRRRGIVDAVSAAPIDGLSAKKGANGTEIALMAQEVGLLFTFGPETDGV